MLCIMLMFSQKEYYSYIHIMYILYQHKIHIDNIYTSICLSQYFIAMKRHYGQDNSYKTKHLI